MCVVCCGYSKYIYIQHPFGQMQFRLAFCGMFRKQVELKSILKLHLQLNTCEKVEN